MRDDETRTEHPAFGKVRIAHVSGRSNLFMVDYPQQHYVTLRVSTATLMRTLSQDWTFADREIIEVGMSEIQWARLIASPNTEGVPCTLQAYRDPATGEHLRPRLPDEHVATQKTFSDEIDKKAKSVSAGVAEALAAVQELLAGGTVKKADLKKIEGLLYQANMNLAENLSFVVQQAEEAIETAVESGKAEVDAHIDFAMTKLGERALGERLTAAIEQGVDVAQVGRSIATAIGEENKS